MMLYTPICECGLRGCNFSAIKCYYWIGIFEVTQNMCLYAHSKSLLPPLEHNSGNPAAPLSMWFRICHIQCKIMLGCNGTGLSLGCKSKKIQIFDFDASLISNLPCRHFIKFKNSISNPFWIFSGPNSNLRIKIIENYFISTYNPSFTTKSFFDGFRDHLPIRSAKPTLFRKRELGTFGGVMAVLVRIW